MPGGAAVEEVVVVEDAETEAETDAARDGMPGDSDDESADDAGASAPGPWGGATMPARALVVVVGAGAKAGVGAVGQPATA